MEMEPIFLALAAVTLLQAVRCALAMRTQPGTRVWIKPKAEVDRSMIVLMALGATTLLAAFGISLQHQ